MGLGIGAVLLWQAPWAVPVAALAACGVGVWATWRAGGAEDPGWVVIDEIAGQLLALLPLTAPRPFGLLAAFALFRLFDIAKPGPVGWVDRQRGAVAVMGDDVVAGALAALCLWAAGWAWPGHLT